MTRSDFADATSTPQSAARATGRAARVLHLSSGLGLGGTEKVMQSLVTRLDPQRYERAVFSFSDGPRRRQILDAGVEVRVGRDLLGFLEKFQPDIVHVHRAGWPEPGLLRPLKLAGVPLVVETNVFGRADATPLGRIVDTHLFVSHFCLRRFLSLENPDPLAEYDVLYNPVDTDLFEAHPVQPDFSAPVVGRVSRPDPGKWSPLALAFLPIALRRIPGMRYHVIGGIPEAFEWVRESGLAEHVVWHAPVETDAELADFLAGVSVLAHANDTGESFGLVIAEAMAMGLPVVTHPCPGLKDNAQLELVDHGVTGIVASTSGEYARAVTHLLENPDLAQRMGLAGRDKARRLFRAQAVAARLEVVYERLLARGAETAEPASASDHAA